MSTRLSTSTITNRPDLRVKGPPNLSTWERRESSMYAFWRASRGASVALVTAERQKFWDPANVLGIDEVGGSEDGVEGVLRVSFNRPPVNAWHDAMWRELHKLFDTISTDNNVAVVVLSGEGRAFTAGLDQALAQGNTEGARIYASNAIRKKNESLNLLRLGSRIDAIALVMDKFENQFEDMDAQTSYMEGAISQQSAQTTPLDQVDLLMQQVADENGIEIKQRVGEVDLVVGKVAALSPAAQQEQAEKEREERKLIAEGSEVGPSSGVGAGAGSGAAPAAAAAAGPSSTARSGDEDSRLAGRSLNSGPSRTLLARPSFEAEAVDPGECIGLAADIGTLQRFPKTVGNDSLARELAYSARTFDAREALAIGFVSKVTEQGQTAVVAAALSLAKDIASKSPIAVQSTKAILLHARDHPVDAGLAFTAAWNAAMLQTEDIQIATQAVMAKQKPAFSKL
ncbi:unnamed protein product [Tilletia caries]|nr:unnamed protein product [Tilletia caries]